MICLDIAIIAGEIVYPRLTRADFLLALTQASLDRYGPGTAEDALIVIDQTLSKPDSLVSDHVVVLPILQTAAESSYSAGATALWTRRSSP